MSECDRHQKSALLQSRWTLDKLLNEIFSLFRHGKEPLRGTQGVHMSSCYFSTHFFLGSEAFYEMEDKKIYLIKKILVI